MGCRRAGPNEFLRKSSTMCLKPLGNANSKKFRTDYIVKFFFYWLNDCINTTERLGWMTSLILRLYSTKNALRDRGQERSYHLNSATAVTSLYYCKKDTGQKPSLSFSEFVQNCIDRREVSVNKQLITFRCMCLHRHYHRLYWSFSRVSRLCAWNSVHSIDAHKDNFTPHFASAWSSTC